MKTINGLMFKQMIISGANNLFNSYAEVDALNVFPVPDGDTGTNMNLTISSGAKEISNRNDEGIYDVAKAFSKGLLMGARGNSGVILSQIFRGFAKSLDGKETINALDLADAFLMGKDVAYKAVMRPVEGTILTVIRESSEELFKQVTRDMSIEQCFEILLKEARESLERTPQLLPVLKEVGVVDSGGAGLVKILEGFEKALQGNVVEKNMADVTKIISRDTSENKDNKYIVEFILKLSSDHNGKKVYQDNRFKSVIATYGSDLSISNNNEFINVHILTMRPGGVLNFAQQYGEFTKIQILKQDEFKESLFKDNKEEPLKEYGLIAVAVGKGIEDLFKEYRVDFIVSGGQTMNPSTEDFVEAIKKVHAKKIFILPNNSNIIMAASQACEVTKDGIEARVISTKTIPQGLTAAMMFNPEVSMDENEIEMKEAMSNVKTGQVTFAIKDTLLDGIEVKKDQFIGICSKSIVCCCESKVQAALKMLETMVDDLSSIISVYIGEGVTNEESEELQSKIEDTYQDLDIDIRQGDQPVYSFIVSVE